MRGAVLLLLFSFFLFAFDAHADRFAVLPVDLGEAKLPLELAEAMREAMTRRGLDVQDAAATRAQMEERMYRGEHKLDQYRARLDAAEQRLQALEEHESVKILRAVVNELSRDAELSIASADLLERARLRLANRLIGIAGHKETGRAETKEGDEALSNLLEALRANPGLAPSEDDFPPRFHVMMTIAREKIAALEKGTIRVASRPPGAAVFVEGRAQPATTPVELTLPRGQYRVWVALPGSDVRSKTKTVEARVPPEKIDVDLEFEGALQGEGPHLRPLPGLGIDESGAKRIGELLKVDTLVLIGTAAYDDMRDRWLWVAAFSVAAGKRTRHGALKLDGISIHDAAAQLATFVVGERADRVEDRPLPKQVLPERSLMASSSNMPSLSVLTKQVVEEAPWGIIGTIAGVVVVLAAAGVTTWAILEYGPRDAEFTFRVVRR